MMSFSTQKIAHVQLVCVSTYFDDKASSLPLNPSPEFMRRFQHEAERISQPSSQGIEPTNLSKEGY